MAEEVDAPKPATSDQRRAERRLPLRTAERALDARQRHKLGAHYTPLAFVERLVNPTVIQPLRTEWETVQATALTQAKLGQEDAAKETVRAFHRRLCEVRVLDPACGSGNVLYVALELMKRLEGEVIALLRDLRDDQGALALAGHTVDPHQFLGIEVCLADWETFLLFRATKGIGLKPSHGNSTDVLMVYERPQHHGRRQGRQMPIDPARLQAQFLMLDR